MRRSTSLLHRPAQPSRLPAAAVSGGDGRRSRPATSRRRSAGFCAGSENVRVWLAEATRDRSGARGSCVLADGEVAVRLPDRRGRARRTPTSVTTSGSAHAPGLKTLEDALDMRRRVLLAFEQAERETRSSRAAPAADVRRRRRRADGRGAGRRARGDLAPRAGERLSRDRSRVGAHHPDRGRPDGAGDVSASTCRRSRASALERLGVAVWTGSLVTDVEAGQRARRRARRSKPARFSGRPASSAVAARRVARRAARSRGPRARQRRPHRCPVIPRSSVVGDLAALKDADGDVAAGRRAGGDAAGARTPRGNIVRVDRRRAARAVRLPQPRQHGDDRPQLRGRRPAAVADEGLPRLAASGCSCTSSS